MHSFNQSQAFYRLEPRGIAMRAAFLIALTCLILTGSTVGAPQAESVYPIAVWYGGGKARAPMQEFNAQANRAVWKKDLEQIRSLGFPAIKTWVEWASSERQEGKYDLGNLEQLLELADETGLRVIIQVYVDSAPDWVGEKNPDARFDTKGELANHRCGENCVC